MKHSSLGLVLVVSLALFSPGPGFSQSADSESAIQAAATAPVAYLYAQTAKGVYAYTASAAGKIAPINSTPYPVVGAMEDANSKYLISVGNTWLHAYPIEPNGALGKQVATINTAAYGGSQCGQTNGRGSTLDRTGKYLYVYLYLPGDGNSDACAVMQSYQVEPNGEFKYLGYIEADVDPQGLWIYPDGVPVFSSNDKFGYALYPGYEDADYNGVIAFKIAANGDLQGLTTFEMNIPEPPGDAWYYYPIVITPDNAGHLAVVLDWFPYGNGRPPRLASFTIAGNGNISSTNTAENMPSLAESGGGMVMSPSGKLLAIPEATGIHLFNFNGAAPITANKRIAIPGGVTGSIAWDNHNHLYAQGTAGIYVYTATPTSVTEVAGSPFKVAAGSWILMPKP